MSDVKFLQEEFEFFLLHYFFNNHNFFNKVRHQIKKSYFNDPKNGIIFQTLHDYVENFKVFPDWKTLELFLNGLPKIETDVKKQIFDVFEVMKGEYEYNSEFVEKSTEDFIKKANFKIAFVESIEDINNPEKFDLIVERMRKALKNSIDKDLGMSLYDVDDRYEVIKEMLNPENKIHSFASFDDVLGGGFERKALYSFAANSGIGKSIFLHNLGCLSFLQGLKVLMITLEISKERLSLRCDSTLTSLTTNELLSDNSKLKDFYSMNKVMHDKSDFIIKEYPANSINCNTILSLLDDLEAYQGFIPDLIIVDYANLLNPIKAITKDNTYVSVKTVYEELRAIAQVRNLPIITASQMNRTGLDAKGGTKAALSAQGLSDSLGIQQTVDGLFIISQTANDKKNSKIYVTVDKNRNGKTGLTIPFDIDYFHLTLSESI